ncbi:MAG TPA: cupin domain-containing protein [Candidatus Binataceae bacterium]|nr:cupin domain-containing protein [Candidatus Binataceae bacterium]
MPKEMRRVVTGHDKDGKSIVIIDGPPSAVGGFWVTNAAPADNSGTADTAGNLRRLEPAPGGSIFRFASIPPDNPNVPAAERERLTAKMFEQMDAAHCRVDTSRHPAMHKTRTVDYVVLLSGEVTMLLDKGEVDLKPFDVVVQRGTNHAWVNKGKEPALIAAVLVDAKDT